MSQEKKINPTMHHPHTLQYRREPRRAKGIKKGVVVVRDRGRRREIREALEIKWSREGMKDVEEN